MSEEDDKLYVVVHKDNPDKILAVCADKRQAYSFKYDMEGTMDTEGFGFYPVTMEQALHCEELIPYALKIQEKSE